MVREIRSGTLNGRYVIDAVQANALDSYLDDHIGPFADNLQRIAQDDAERFITSGKENQ
jgi:hypothetical protein